ncbi:hypothetical protein [Arsenophonus nasoniae]|uniref:Uncharacterized protein n=1 Tax=Arsenophonus nasoniae TaxID=638 RepID=A0A4P7L2C2_9GAMM|nr:hypothetical protein [Arsenophonus nasoniae]QBY46909.1 hypothetical protein ArsFIN_55200 [Arsenophonus nasoniae]
MDKEKIKIGFNAQSAKLIDFLSHFKKITYASTLLVIDNQITDHQSNGYAGWDKKFYYDGLHKDSLLIKVGIELTKIKEGETSTVIWDDVLKTDPKNKIKALRESNNIYHGISFIYGLSENISLSINTCTSKDIKKEDFENFILPMRFELLNFFKELNNVY